MENATKALLIAAAVLIVILLIAFGMRIFNGTTAVQGQADQVGGAITNQSSAAGEAATSAIQGITVPSTKGQTPTETPTETPTNP